MSCFEPYLAFISSRISSLRIPRRCPPPLSLQGWRRLDDLLSFLPGQSFEFRQESIGVAAAAAPLNLLELKGSATAAGGGGGGSSAVGDERKEQPTTTKDGSTTGAAASSGAPRKKPLTLVCFLGGVTMAEISALRYLSEREDHARDYIVCTTKLINGSTFVESIVEVVNNKLNGGGQQQSQQQQSNTTATSKPMMATSAPGKR
jgi:hypothetical protein